jgi:hypothetical protein
MYPNPQDVLALPPHASLEQYKKRAKALVDACKSGQPGAIHVWAFAWIRELVSAQRESDRPPESHIDDVVTDVARFAGATLSRKGRTAGLLADAQFVIARVHGLKSWPKFAAYLEALARVHSPASAFEAAADAIVAGDETTLRRLLREDPGLVRARSTREHRATLLHYSSANGVENYRQRTPGNAARLAGMLIEAGAEVDAEADVYGGGCTTLGLVATSEHPFKAGVQRELIDVLLEHGARMDHPGSTGNQHDLVRGCLANGRSEAAEYLVSRGAPLDFVGAAGLGRLDAVKRAFEQDGRLNADQTERQLKEAFSFASIYGRTAVVEFIVQTGTPIDTELKGHGEGHTALHVAAFHAHVDLVKALLKRGARVDVNDKTWGTPPLVWALTGWRLHPPPRPERFHEVVALLVGAGAVVKREWLEKDPIRSDPKMIAALTPS